MQPKVSIIIPVYNVENYILDCLKSVVSQSIIDDIECILVDDCGQDQSIEIAEQYISSIRKKAVFQLLHHEHNRGLSAARNTGIDVATGEYLFFLDSDDELTSTSVEMLLNLAKAYKADMVQGCYKAEMEMLTNFWETIPEFSDDNRYIKRIMLDYDHFPVMAQNRLVRRTLILENKLYFKEGIIHEDKLWTFFLAKYVNRLAVCSIPSYIYRTTPGSITSTINIRKEQLSCRTYLIDFYNNIDDFEIGAQKKWIFINLLAMWNARYYESKQDAKTLVLLFLKHNTLIERMLVRIILCFNGQGFLYCKCVNLLQRIYLLQK